MKITHGRTKQVSFKNMKEDGQVYKLPLDDAYYIKLRRDDLNLIGVVRLRDGYFIQALPGAWVEESSYIPVDATLVIGE